jgi:hypothetical protein
MRDDPGRDEVLGESADLVPIFVPSELLVKLVPELIAQGRLDVSPVEAAPGTDHASGQPVELAPEISEAEIKQLPLFLSSLALLLSGPHLMLGSLDHAGNEGLEVAQGR